MAGIAAVAGCGGAEFGKADPGLELDGSTDTKPPSSDGRSTGGSGGSGASGGTSGTGGTTGTGGTGPTGGATGTGGAGATGGATGSGGTGATGGAAGTGGNAGADAGKGGSFSNDASNDARLDASDGSADATIDGASNDVTADRSSDADASGDATTSSDTNNSADAGNDNRSDASIADACQPITYYKDDDSDGFGKTNESTSSCTPPSGKWSVLNGDCRDDLPNVKPFSPASPDPPQYSGTGYAENNKPQGISFDYDCTGAEEADPNNSYGIEPDCPSILNCSGVGYIAVNPARTGTGINPRCGSTQLKRCQVLLAEGTPALCNVTIEVTSEAYRCR